MTRAGKKNLLIEPQSLFEILLSNRPILVIPTFSFNRSVQKNKPANPLWKPPTAPYQIDSRNQKQVILYNSTVIYVVLSDLFLSKKKKDKNKIVKFSWNAE